MIINNENLFLDQIKKTIEQPDYITELQAQVDIYFKKFENYYVEVQVEFSDPTEGSIICAEMVNIEDVDNEIIIARTSKRIKYQKE